MKTNGTGIGLAMALSILTGCGGQTGDTPDSAVVVMPEFEVPFASSETKILGGSADPAGGCVFSNPLTVDAGELQPGETKVRVRRAVDLSRCEEIVEEGVVLGLLDLLPSIPIINSGQVQAAPAETKALDLPLIPVESRSTTYTFSARVTYVDRRSPLVSALPFLFGDGMDVSYVDADMTLNSGDCRRTSPSAETTFRNYSQALTGWTSLQSQFSRTIDCSKAVSEARVVHHNTQDTLLLTNCSNGGFIRYEPFKVTITMSGQRTLSSSDRVTGDVAQCGEYLTRVQSIN
ncbi:MAG: hypothetical protein ABF296_05635 [Oceanococcaceae bacterium]